MEVRGLMVEGASKQEGSGEMRKRRTTLEDGRYLIYYTFGEEGGESQMKEEGASKRGADAEPVAEEERRV